MLWEESIAHNHQVPLWDTRRVWSPGADVDKMFLGFGFRDVRFRLSYLMSRG